MENLFDTIDDPQTYDHEWTPKGKYKWGLTDFESKIEKMSSTLYHIGAETTGLPPVIIGVCEIENAGVVERLINTEPMSNFDMQIIHYDSPDRRGIDVALIYDRRYFTPTNSQAHELILYDERNPKKRYFTRDQLVVSGLLGDQKIHLIINHWPSRRGGKAKSYVRRRSAARLTRSIADSLFAEDPNAGIVIMGDLNDDPLDKSVKLDLGSVSRPKRMSSLEFYNPMVQLYRMGMGTLAWRDSWNLFDQILVSRRLVQHNAQYLRLYKAGIFNPDFLITPTGPYKGYPFRAMKNNRYNKGYSDHFPVYIQLIRPVKKD